MLPVCVIQCNGKIHGNTVSSSNMKGIDQQCKIHRPPKFHQLYLQKMKLLLASSVEPASAKIPPLYLQKLKVLLASSVEPPSEKFPQLYRLTIELSMLSFASYMFLHLPHLPKVTPFQKRFCKNESALGFLAGSNWRTKSALRGTEGCVAVQKAVYKQGGQSYKGFIASNVGNSGICFAVGAHV